LELKVNWRSATESPSCKALQRDWRWNLIGGKSELEIKFPYVLLAGGGRSKTTEGGLDNRNLIGVGFSTEIQLELKSNWRSSPQAGEKPEAK